MTGAEPRLQDLGASHGLAGVFQRVRQALGDLVAVGFRAGQLAQQRDGSVLGRVVGGVPGARQDGERGLDEAAARRRAVLELQRIVVRRQRRGVVARVREGARAPRERRDGLRRRPQDLIERGGRSLRVTERLQQVSVRSERRVGRLAAFGRRTFGARAKPLAQPRPTVASRQFDQPPGHVVVVGAFQQRALGAFDERASSPCDEPASQRAPARAATGTSRAVTSARRRTPER